MTRDDQGPGGWMSAREKQVMSDDFWVTVHIRWDSLRNAKFNVPGMREVISDYLVVTKCSCREWLWIQCLSLKGKKNCDE